VKGDKGVITYKTTVPLAGQIGAQKLIIVKDIRSLLQSLREKGIYTIARIVVFKDDVLATRPELAVKKRGKIWRDRENLAWVDGEKEVWDYNIDLAVEAATHGFGEIQFDYVSFPTEWDCNFCTSTEETGQKHIRISQRGEDSLRTMSFLPRTYSVMSAEPDDTQIGQKLSEIADVDYLSPMPIPQGFSSAIPLQTLSRTPIK
jgi:hypothetical protein